MTKKELILSTVLGVFLFTVLARVNLFVGIDTLYAQTALNDTFQTDSDEDDAASDSDICVGILDQGLSNFSVRNVHFDDGSMTIAIRRLQ